jgi:Tol biopolymer transport system component
MGVCSNKQFRTICLICAVNLVLNVSGCGAGGRGDPDLFGIYTTTLDGKDVKMIISDPSRQMTHARVSPDKEWITFTRYNEKGLLSGLASEENGYTNTEIMIVRLDGSGLESVIPPKKGIIASNGSWTPDGKGITYLSTDNPERHTQINQIDLATRKITTVKTPDHLKPSDPFRVGNRIVFPSIDKDLDVLWLMNIDGTDARQITRPKIPQPKKRRLFPLGDYDPKLSPDNSKVAAMRYFGGEIWHIFVLDLATGKEKELSTGEVSEGLPEWSSDGKLLIFTHWDRKYHRKMGIYSVRPDGNDREMVPLPRGFLLNHANFFPGEGSSKDARIVYVAKKFPGLP